MQITPGPRTSAWKDLGSHAAQLSGVATAELFARDPGRVERFTRQAVGLQMDYSRQHIDEIALSKLYALIESVPGFKKVDITFPATDLPSTVKLLPRLRAYTKAYDAATNRVTFTWDVSTKLVVREEP